MKKKLVIAFTVALMLCFAVPAYATTGSKQVNASYQQIAVVVDANRIYPTDVNGNYVYPLIIDGTVYLPVRAIAHAFRYEVGWDASTNTVFIGINSDKYATHETPAQNIDSVSDLVLNGPIETKSVNVSYKDIKIVLNNIPIHPTDANGNTVEPFIMNGTTYLPVRAVATAMRKDVEWDSTNKIVYIGKKNETSLNSKLQNYVDSNANNATLTLTLFRFMWNGIKSGPMRAFVLNDNTIALDVMITDTSISNTQLTYIKDSINSNFNNKQAQFDDEVLSILRMDFGDSLNVQYNIYYMDELFITYTYE
jgi:hypothetical protein